MGKIYFLYLKIILVNLYSGLDVVLQRFFCNIVGGMTPDTHGRPHGLRPQGRPSPQDEALQDTERIKIPKRGGVNWANHRT